MIAATVLAAGGLPEGAPLPPPAEPGRLLAAGDVAMATTLLQQRIATNPRDVEAYFLLGMIAVRQRAYGTANKYFREALAIAPGQVRIRLELARVLFLQGNYRSALRHFQLVETGHLPPAVRKNVDRFIGAIRNAKDWSYNLDIALAPDTNINNATSASEALILGLPFTIDQSARRKSGTGLALSANIEFAPRVAKHVRWRMGAFTVRRDYRRTTFDDHVYGAYTGPRTQAGAFDISILAFASIRDYGGRVYQHSLGGRLEGAYYTSPKTVAQLTVNVEHLSFPAAPAQDGMLLTLDAGLIKAFTPVSSGSAEVAAFRQASSSNYYSNRGGLLGFSYRRELAGGFGIELRPSISYARYDAADPLFGRRRTDFNKEISLSAANQKFSVWQFTPRLTYRYSQRSSSIGVYSYRQHRLEIGLATDF
ncbi:MAG: surface lipoprotein assembly modifier [Pseudomonadota bacterium]